MISLGCLGAAGQRDEDFPSWNENERDRVMTQRHKTKIPS